ncbi:FAD-dependent oxidoreductase, partial [Escherichia coli]|nr:FAD-dependent oxidoreductase [Escherichia coli]
SDERYTVEGGNDLLPRRLAQIVGDAIQLDSALEAVSQRSDGQYVLAFRQGGRSVQVVAPRVVLALPFTLLREVAIGVPLPAVKLRAIRE